MDITFLGGASEVGASCNLIQINGLNLLVDAGIRMGNNSLEGVPADSLPDLSRISELGGVDAVLVTHAHMDHIGALPLIHESYPHAPIYALKPTIRLMQVLLADALKIMQIKAEQEMDVPLYDPIMVERMFTKVIGVEYNNPVNIGENVDIYLFPAGHILGASCVGVEVGQERLLITGDISLSDQRTVAGASIPDFPAQALIIESTYGNRMHSNRDTEEKRLATAINDTIKDGGKVLIPAFALGRAQEVILILQAFQRSGVLPKVPVWVDGMVRSICGVYSDYPRYLTPSLRRRIENHGNPFYLRKGLVRPVNSSSQRQKIVRGKPCIIVASSGMLNGGASQYYASILAEKEENSILLTGYQDEESPGHRLMEIAEKQGGGQLKLGDEVVNFNCEVGKYGLSAHADVTQLKALVSRINPEKVVLVHGDRESRENMGSVLSMDGVHLPENGDTVSFEVSKRKHSGQSLMDIIGTKTGIPTNMLTQISTGTGLPDGSEFTKDSLRVIWKALNKYGKGRPSFSIAEIAALCHGKPVDEKQIEKIDNILNHGNNGQIYFVNDYKRPFLFRPESPYRVRLGEQRLQLMKDAPSLKGTLMLIKSPDEGGVLPGVCYDTFDIGFRAWKVGTGDTSHYADEIVDIVGPWNLPGEADSGREKRKLSEVSRQSEIYKKSMSKRDVYNKLVSFGRRFSLHEAIGKLIPKNKSNIGWSLAIALHLSDEDMFCRSMESITNIYYEVKEGIDDSMFDGASADNEGEMPEKMEQNTALAAVDTIFPDGCGLYKKGAHPEKGILLLSFEFPQIAENNYAEDIKKLEKITGWEVSINDKPHQGALERAVLKVIPENWIITKGPSVHVDKNKVTVKCMIPGSIYQEDIKKKAGVYISRYFNTTGFNLEIMDDKGNAIVYDNSQYDEKRIKVDESINSLKEQVFYPREGDSNYDSMREEINQAYSIIKKHFAAKNVPIYKTSKKQIPGTSHPCVEVSFITPQKGQEYSEDLKKLALDLGWALKINPNPNQHGVKQWVLQNIPKEWHMTKEPSFYGDKGCVEIKLSNPPCDSSEEVLVFKNKFKQFCSYDLIINKI